MKYRHRYFALDSASTVELSIILCVYDVFVLESQSEQHWGVQSLSHNYLNYHPQRRQRCCGVCSTDVMMCI